MSLYDRLKAAQQQDPSIADKPAAAGQEVIDALRHNVADDRPDTEADNKRRRLPFVLGILLVVVFLIIVAIVIAVFLLGYGRQWFPLEQAVVPPAATISTPIPAATLVPAVAVQPTVVPSPTAKPMPSPTNVPTTGPTAVPTVPPTAAPLPQGFVEPKDVVTPDVDQVVDGEGVEHGQFNHPQDVAIDSKGALYVVDTGNHRVQRVNADGLFIIYWGRNGPGNGTHDLLEPVAAAVDKQDNVLILDAATGWVKRYTSEGEYLSQWAGPGAGLYQPRDMMVDFDGNVWIVDTGNARLLRYAPNGQIQLELGPGQVGTTNLREPVSLAMDGQSNLYVADTGSQKIIKLDRDRKVIAEWPIPAAGSTLGNHLAVTANQSLLVTDPEANRVLEYTLEGKLMRAWGVGGNGPGQFAKPVGIEVHGNRVYVVDTFNNRLQILLYK